MKIETTEWCPFCENESTKKVKDTAKSMKCQHCHKKLYLCDECTYKFGDCVPTDPQSYCYKKENK